MMHIVAGGSLRVGAVVLLSLVCGLAPALAQARLTGRVRPTTESKRFYPPVRVVVEHDGGDRWLTMADAAGRYTFPDLPPGRYRVYIDEPRFEPFAGAVEVREHATAFDVKLTPADPAVRCGDGGLDAVPGPYPCSQAKGVIIITVWTRGPDAPPAPEDDEEAWRAHSQAVEDTPLILENAVTGQRHHVITEGQEGAPGHATVTMLEVGTYQIIVESPFYRPFRSTPFELPTKGGRWVACCSIVRLEYAPHETVTVTAKAFAPSDGSGGVVLTREDLEQLPATLGRTVQSYQQLVPGLVITDTVSGSLAQATAIGQRRLANRMTIDGVEADLALPLLLQSSGESASGGLPAYSTLGSTQTLVSNEAIEEIQVRTTNAASGHARTPGAQTAIVTRAGGDRWTGSAFGEGRARSMTARDWFVKAGQLSPRGVESWTAGASAGGPLWRRRLFGFGTWERQEIRRPTTATILVPSLSARDAASAAIRSVLDAFPRPNGPERQAGLADHTAEFPIASGLSAISARLDARLSVRHRVFTRINRGTSGGDSIVGSVLVQSPFKAFRYDEASTIWTATVGLTSILGPSTTHELRANATENGASLTARAASFGGAKGLALSTLAPDGWVRVSLFPGPDGFVIGGQAGTNALKQWQLIDAWTLLRGAHEWRAGVEYRRLVSTGAPSTRSYSYQFAGVESALAGQVPNLSVQLALGTRVKIEQMAAYVEDSWRATPRLSLTYGLRYSIKPAPSSLTGVDPLVFDFDALPALKSRAADPLWPTSWTDLAPRVAATWQLRDVPGQEMTIRTGWSLTFDDLTSPGLLPFGRGYPYISRSFIQAGAFPVPPEELAAAQSLTFDVDGGEAFAFWDLVSPRVYQWQIGLDRALGQHQRVAATYVGAASRALPHQEAHFIDSARLVLGYSNAARADYHGLLTEYARRLSRGWQARAAYTWGRSIDTDSGESTVLNVPAAFVAPQENRGASDFDRRHVLQATVSYQMPRLRHFPTAVRHALSDWQMDVVGMFRSGTPVTVLGGQRVGGASYLMRPDVVPGIPVWIADATSPTGQRLNPQAFRMPSDPKHGTLSRNALRASPLRQIDAAIARTFRVGGIRVRARLEVFNVFDTVNVGPPYNRLGQSFGQTFLTYAEALGAGSLAGGGLSPIQQIGGPRSAQLGVRVDF